VVSARSISNVRSTVDSDGSAVSTPPDAYLHRPRRAGSSC
jgi:hypothetical protein